MKLDGEKLLAAFNERLDRLNTVYNQEKSDKDFLGMQLTMLQIREAERAVSALESGDYTIDKEGE